MSKSGADSASVGDIVGVPECTASNTLGIGEETDSSMHPSNRHIRNQTKLKR